MYALLTRQANMVLSYKDNTYLSTPTSAHKNNHYKHILYALALTPSHIYMFHIA